jgi:hypothetical protein
MSHEWTAVLLVSLLVSLNNWREPITLHKPSPRFSLNIALLEAAAAPPPAPTRPLSDDPPTPRPGSWLTL